MEANPTGSATYTQYIYDAEGRRVAKGSGTSLSCGAPTTANRFTLSSQYLLDQSGNQAYELGASGNWIHSNIWEGGRLSGTYTSTGLHFAIADPLGTKRVQAVVTSSGTGAPELNCLSLPFGNNVGNTLLSNCVAVGSGGTDATEHHFTGKERDTESGNDYFGARYYASSMGRFMSPDWSAKEEPVPYAKLDDPQSLNLYAYVRNNPLVRETGGNQGQTGRSDGFGSTANDSAIESFRAVSCGQQRCSKIVLRRRPFFMISGIRFKGERPQAAPIGEKWDMIPIPLRMGNRGACGRFWPRFLLLSYCFRLRNGYDSPR